MTTPALAAPAAFLAAQKTMAQPYLRYTIAIGGVNAVLLIIQAWLIAHCIDALVFNTVAAGQFNSWLMSLLLIFILRALLNWGAEQTAFQAAAQVKLTLRARVYRHIQAAGPYWLTSQRSGALAEDLIKGIEALEAYYARYLPAMTLTAVIPLAILFTVLPLDWVTVVMMLITAPFIPIFMILIGKRVEVINQQQWRTLARMGAHFLDVIQGLATLKLFNASRRETQVIAELSDVYRRQTLAVLRVAFLSSAVLEFFATVGIAMIAVLIGFRLYNLTLPLPDWLTPPDITFAQGFFILLLAPEFYLPLRAMGTHYHSRLEAIAAAERLIAILATPLPSLPAQPQRLLTNQPLTIQFNHVQFAYEPGRAALIDVNFSLTPGERVAIVGASGAGKTTIANLLLGFIRPDQGTILIAGQPLDQLDMNEWRRQLAWLPQRPRLFQGSILDNIRLGRPELSTAAVEYAARRARAAEFIEKLPNGYNTIIGESGVGLSGGQIQRIALARAFIRDAQLVLFDEATASLDPENESLVQAGIDELAQGRTVIMIAHRLATVTQADRILVLSAGQLVEQGTHQQLLAQRGYYCRLVAALAG